MPASPAPSSGTQTPAGAASSAPAPSRGHSNRPDHPALPTTQPLSTAAVFIKGIVDPVTNSQLQNILTSRFGPLKEIEVVRSKACAFAEFNTVESARRAITASMNEGGVYIDAAGEGNQVRIVIETRKERGDRPPTRPRGGAPVNGEGRGGHGGGYRGRGAGRGRGGPPPGK